jgi:hypothetical protein
MSSRNCVPVTTEGRDDGLHQNARDQSGQVALDVSGDRPAEQVGEHQGEQDRLDGDVDELLGVRRILISPR